jgi:hypothetical protein
MIDVVCWKWKAAPGYRSQFTADSVNVFGRMVRRHYAGPLRLTCITDDPAGITEMDRVLPLWDDFAAMKSPHDIGGRINPACYRRLKQFDAQTGAAIGNRIMSLDLDVVILGNLEPVFDRPEPIVLWGDTNPTTYYNGGMILHTAGEHAFLWDEFKADPLGSVRAAQKSRQWGSDQGWISHRLGPHQARFGPASGVFSYRNDIRPTGGDYARALPANARIVFFHGETDPWDDQAQRLEWVRDNWR